MITRIRREQEKRSTEETGESLYRKKKLSLISSSARERERERESRQLQTQLTKDLHRCDSGEKQKPFQKRRRKCSGAVRSFTCSALCSERSTARVGDWACVRLTRMCKMPQVTGGDGRTTCARGARRLISWSSRASAGT